MIHDGLYNIVPSWLMQPSPGIGADTDTDTDSGFRVGAGIPTVFDGTNQVWNVKKQSNGTYTLTLEEGWHSVANEEAVMVNITIPIGEHWHLEQRPGHRYLITPRHGVIKLAWTLHRADDKEAVVLRPAEEPYNFQEWIFRRVLLD